MALSGGSGLFELISHPLVIELGRTGGKEYINVQIDSFFYSCTCRPQVGMHDVGQTMSSIIYFNCYPYVIQQRAETFCSYPFLI